MNGGRCFAVTMRKCAYFTQQILFIDSSATETVSHAMAHAIHSILLESQIRCHDAFFSRSQKHQNCQTLTESWLHEVSNCCHDVGYR